MNSKREEHLAERIAQENLTLEVTTECNSACSHCFARAGLEKTYSMTIEEVDEILVEGCDLGYKHLHITGGEPLLWKPLFEALDSACTIGYEKIFLNTNGTLLTRDNAELLSKHKDKLTISISLHGNEKQHDKIRGQGKWEQATHGLKNAISVGLEPVVFTVMGKSLVPELPHYANSLFDDFKGIEKLTLIQLIRVTNDTFDLSTELLSPNDFITMVQSASLLKLYGLHVEILENPLVNVVANKLNMPWLSQGLPLHRSGRLVIMANKEITFTHSTRKSLEFYSKGKLEEILYSDEYNDEIQADDVLCPACRHHELCRKNHMIRPSEAYRDMHPEVPFCKRVLDGLDSL